jgi:hypothetical protein
VKLAVVVSKDEHGRLSMMKSGTVGYEDAALNIHGDDKRFGRRDRGHRPTQV